MTSNQSQAGKELRRILLGVYVGELGASEMNERAVMKQFDHPLLDKARDRILALIQSQRQEAVVNELTSLIVDCTEADLQGKGYDWYFVVRTKLDELKQSLKANKGRE